MSRKSLSVAACVIGLLVLSSWMRFSHLDHLLPGFPEPDRFFVFQAESFRQGLDPESATDTAYGAYPHLLARALSVIPLENAPRAAADPRSLQDQLALAARELVQARALIAALGSLAVLLTWLLARRFFSARWSLLAMAFLATSLLHMVFSQEARVHAGSSALALAAVLGCVLLVRRGTWGSYALAGLVCALALGSLQTGAAVLLPLVVAHGLAPRPGGWRGHLRLAVPAALLALALVAFYPFLGATLRDTGGEADSGTYFAHMLGFDHLGGGGFFYLLEEALGYDPVLTLLALLGALVGVASLVRRREPLPAGLRQELWVVAAYVVPYGLALSFYDHLWQRFLLPLWPFLALLAAYFVRETASCLGHLVGRPAGRALATGLLVLGALAFPAALSAKLMLLRARDDTLEQCAAWMRAELDREQDEILTSPWLTLPLHGPPSEGSTPGPNEIMDSLPWFAHRARLPAELTQGQRWRLLPLAPGGRWPTDFEELERAFAAAPRVLRDRAPDYVILASEPKFGAQMDRAVMAWGRRLRTFGPFPLRPRYAFHPRWMYQNQDPVGFEIAREARKEAVWSQVWRAEALGPNLEVYVPR